MLCASRLKNQTPAGRAAPRRCAGWSRGNSGRWEPEAAPLAVGPPACRTGSDRRSTFPRRRRSPGAAAPAPARAPPAPPSARTAASASAGIRRHGIGNPALPSSRLHNLDCIERARRDRAIDLMRSRPPRPGQLRHRCTRSNRQRSRGREGLTDGARPVQDTRARRWIGRCSPGATWCSRPTASSTTTPSPACASS